MHKAHTLYCLRVALCMIGSFGMNACVIINCSSNIGVVVVGVVSGQFSWLQVLSHEILGQHDIHFSNDSHFKYFL